MESFSVNRALPETKAGGREASKPEVPLKSVVADAERQHILASLEAEQWHRGKTAARLGINRRTLERKMKLYQIGGGDKNAAPCDM